MNPASTALRTAERIAAAFDEWEFEAAFAQKDVADGYVMNAAKKNPMDELRVFPAGARWEVRKRMRQ